MAREDSKHTRSRGKSASKPIVAHDAPTQENISIFEDGDNEFAEMVEKRHGMDPRAKAIFICCVVLVVVYVIAIIIPKDMINDALHYGGYNSGYSFAWFVEDLQANISGVVAVLTGNGDQINYAGTMIRYVVVVFAGAGLALCGAVYQGSFRNALVSPSSMGVMAGSSLGVIIWLLFYVNDECSNIPWISNVSDSLNATVSANGDIVEYLISSYSYSLFAFVGCMVVVGLVLLVMAFSKKNSTSGLMIIIIGQVFGGIVGSVTSLVRYYMTQFDEFTGKLEVLNTTAIGSFFRDYTFIDIVAVGIPIILCVVIVLKLNQRLMVLSFGNEQARSMGVDTKKTQLLVVGISTLLTAVIISFCGTVGFVGFLVPHLARRLVGPNFKYLLPASMAVGGLFVLAAYTLVAMLLGPNYENMVGMFISIGGAAVFLVQALRGAGGGGGLGRGLSR